MSPFRLHLTCMVKVGLLLAFLISALAAGSVESSEIRNLHGVPDGLRLDEVRRSVIRVSSADRQSLPGYYLQRAWPVDDLRSDVSYLLGERDFCVMLSVLAMAPGVFKSAFRSESPEFTEMWGASSFADQFFEPGEFLGSAVYPLAASALCLSLGKLRHSPAAESFGHDMLRAHAVNGLITLTLKGAIDRRRPDGSSYSYPSGHTSTAFTSASVIHRHFGDVWAVPAYLIAAHIGLSRLQEGKHYLTDVIAGAILGTCIAHKLACKGKKASSFSMSPFLTHRTFGAQLAVRF